MSIPIIITLVLLYFAFGTEIIDTYNKEDPHPTKRLVYLIAIIVWPLITLVRFIFYIFGEEK
jgi:hypothetical protein